MPSYVAKTGLNLNTSKKNPEGTRVEAGEEFSDSKLSKKTVKWLLERGYAEELSDSSTPSPSSQSTSSTSSTSEDEDSGDSGDTSESEDDN